MKVEDNNLSALLQYLDPRERRAVERHLAGEKTDESAAVLRWIKRRLKRRARKRAESKRRWLM